MWSLKEDRRTLDWNRGQAQMPGKNSPFFHLCQNHPIFTRFSGKGECQFSLISEGLTHRPCDSQYQDPVFFESLMQEREIRSGCPRMATLSSLVCLNRSHLDTQLLATAEQK
jgi:hypothetical protein